MPNSDVPAFTRRSSPTGPSVPSPRPPLTGMGTRVYSGWAPCQVCGWWEYNPSIPATSERPFCRRCESYLHAGRLHQCAFCGWWDWNHEGDCRVCEYCLRFMARRMQLIFPTLPVSVCARIVYWELHIDIDVAWQSWSSDDAASDDDSDSWYPFGLETEVDRGYESQYLFGP